MKITLQLLTFVTISSLTIIFNSCKKSDTPAPVPVPPTDVVKKLTLVSATVYQDGGVSLIGKVNQIPDAVLDYGFLIAKDSLFKNGVQVFSIKTPIKLGEYKADVHYGMSKDSLYYVTAYAITSIGNSAYSYSFFNIKSFVSTGAKIVKIDSIYPSKALIGDTISIKGKYFTGHSFSIGFGDRSAGLVSINDSVLKCVVPTDLKVFNPAVLLKEGTKTDTVSKKFSLYAPTIESFTSTATFRDTVTINGNYFNRYVNGNQVSFGTVAGTVISSTKNQIKVVVPDNIQFSKTIISVKAQLQTMAATSQFIIRKPELTIVPGSGKVDEAILIQGKYFHPTVFNNTVTFENTPATFTSGTTTKLALRIPNGAYPNRKAKVVLKVLDYEIAYTSDMAINDKWIVVNDQIPFSSYVNSGTFTINNISYIITGSKDYFDRKKYVWKFNASDYSWAKSEIPFSFDVGRVVAVGTKAYFYTGTDLNNFWEYNTVNNQWVQKSSYMAGVRFAGTLSAVGNNIYLGVGRKVLAFDQQPDNTVYKYDIANDTWQKETDYPTDFGNNERIHASTFVINNEIYFACGSTNTGMLQFKKYTPATKTWVTLANFPDARSYTTAFVFQGAGYIAGGADVGGGPSKDCYRYNVASNTWTRLPDDIGAGNGFEKAFAFVNNGKVFFGGGNSSSDRYQLFMADNTSL
ncbi:IPT/TIG domain-containing protein [Pedobacter duraquae]|uniref:N-acetylneuraminic acid mutarotase n=1 Tax=Pedobacter duraquae TaxID=425511 RepID=A0A4R6IHU9_9SPHI|nr:IPT/TIG domain-containing protein [Pedobacter duraquae]TDO21325.1 N-acetylneuraminic acid mutarotase [Pedobacter duraquae]